MDIITKQFNEVTPEHLLKFESVHPAADRYTFDAQDRFVQFGVERKMQIVGYNARAANQTGTWALQAADGKPADRETLLARMRDHIRTVVGRYKGKIQGWDVVNEAIDEDGSLRKTPWRDGTAMTTSRRRSSSRARRIRTPTVSQRLQPRETEKRAGVIGLVKDLKARGLRIDGIGNQAHWRLEMPTIDAIDKLSWTCTAPD